MQKVVPVHPQHCQRPPPSIMLEVVCVHLQHYARSCPPAPQSGLAIVGGAVTSWRLASRLLEEDNSKKQGRIRKNGERRIIRVGNRVHNKQVVELGAGVEGGKKRAGMEEKLGEGIEWKEGRRLEEGKKGFPRHPSCDNEDQQQVVVPSHGNYAPWLLTV